MGLGADMPRGNPKGPKVITSFQLDLEPHQALHQLAAEQNVSVSDLVRASIWSSYGDRHPGLDQLRAATQGTAVAAADLAEPPLHRGLFHGAP
jgi:hypothetical protein